MGAVSDVVAALWVRISYLQFHTIKHREQRRVMNMEKHASSLEKANHASPLLCLKGIECFEIAFKWPL